MVNQSKINDPRFWKKWRESGAVNNLYDQNKLRFNPPNAKGLKKEILDRVGDKHIFKVGKPKNIPIGESYKRTEYAILMDGNQIGNLVRVIGPHFDNTVYEGRLPGYVNESIKLSNEFEGEVRNHMPVDQVILQHTIEHYPCLDDLFDDFGDYPGRPKGPRKDGHNLRFVD